MSLRLLKLDQPKSGGCGLGGGAHPPVSVACRAAGPGELPGGCRRPGPGGRSSIAIQGIAGLPAWALLAASQPLLEAIKGLACLAFLAVQARRSAIKGQYQPLTEEDQRHRCRALIG